MSERRKKAKEKMESQKRDALTSEKLKSEALERMGNRKARLDRFGAYLVDVSKFIITGVVITSLYKEFSITDSRTSLYISIAFSLVILAAGIRLTYKK